MSDKSPAGPASSPPPESVRQGVSRAVGLGISAATALIVFVVGSAIFPASKPAEQPVAVVAPPPPPPPPPPPVVPEAGAAPDATAPEAGVAEVGAEKAAKIATAEPDAGEPDPETPGKKKKGRKDKGKDGDKDKAVEADGSKRENAVLPPSDGTATTPSEASSADCALPEKDMAHEAWRRNWPTVCPIPSTGKAFILIPIKGPIEGETHELRRKPKREARVMLPAGSESQLTMKQYKLNKLGFKGLSVSNTESGAKLRVKLEPGAGDPVFEVKDGYAKITVATPAKD